VKSSDALPTLLRRCVFVFCSFLAAGPLRAAYYVNYKLINSSPTPVPYAITYPESEGTLAPGTSVTVSFNQGEFFQSSIYVGGQFSENGNGQYIWDVNGTAFKKYREFAGVPDEQPPLITVDIGRYSGPTPAANQPIWGADSNGTTLDGAMFRDGVFHIVDAINQNAPSGGSGGSLEGGRNVTGNNVDDVAALQLAIKTGENGNNFSNVDQLLPGGPTGVKQLMLDKADEASVAETALLTSAAGGAAPTALGYEIGVGEAPAAFAISLGPKLGNVTINWNPFTEERLAGVAAAFRTGMIWVTLMILGIWVWKELDTKAHQFGTAPQVKGNTIAGTGGQLTATLAAVLISVVVVTGLTALVAWGFDSITFGALRSNMATNPFSGFASGAMYCLDQIFPVVIMVTALVARLSWHLYSVPLYVGAQAFVRFINP
jgi:hypothetical protein